MGNTPNHEPPALGPLDVAVLRVLVESSGRVVGRQEIARRAGLQGTSARRCDSLLVNVRRYLGGDSIRTVRGRGWILEPHALDSARAALE